MTSKTIMGLTPGPMVRALFLFALKIPLVVLKIPLVLFVACIMEFLF